MLRISLMLVFCLSLCACVRSVSICETTGETGACVPVLVVGDAEVDASDVADECAALGGEPVAVPSSAVELDAIYVACISAIESCGSFCGCWLGDGYAISLASTSTAEYSVVEGPPIPMLPVCVIR